jgi:hypothetical protein
MSSKSTESYEPDIRSGKAIDDFRKTAFVHQSCGFARFELFGFSEAFLWPVIELSFHPK